MAHSVIDLHCDTVFYIMDGVDLLQPNPGIHVTLPRLREGGIVLQVFAVYVPPETGKEMAFNYTTERLDAIEAFARSDNSFVLVETAAELKSSMAAEKIGIMLAVENGLPIGDSLEKLEELRRRKVRIMTLVHSQHMPWIESCTGTGQFSSDSSRSRGLSRFGEQVVDAMNDLGIIPDVSHSSENAFWDVIKRSKKPIIASHSCAYKFCAAPRNLKDDQLKALGDSGGVVGVNFFSGFLNESYRQRFDEIIKSDPEIFTQIMETKHVPGMSVRVPMSDIADHIDHMVKVAGEDCVALGSDFDGIPAAPEGVMGSDYYPVLEKELRSRGYSESRLEKIFNANFARLLEVWR